MPTLRIQLKESNIEMKVSPLKHIDRLPLSTQTPNRHQSPLQPPARALSSARLSIAPPAWRLDAVQIKNQNQNTLSEKKWESKETWNPMQEKRNHTKHGRTWKE